MTLAQLGSAWLSLTMFVWLFWILNGVFSLRVATFCSNPFEHVFLLTYFFLLTFYMKRPQMYLYIFCNTKVIAFCRNIFRRITTIWFWYIFILVCLSHALPSCGHQIRIYGQILKSKAYSAPCRFVTLFPFERESYSWTHNSIIPIPIIHVHIMRYLLT